MKLNNATHIWKMLQMKVDIKLGAKAKDLGIILKPDLCLKYCLYW